MSHTVCTVMFTCDIKRLLSLLFLPAQWRGSLRAYRYTAVMLQFLPVSRQIFPVSLARHSLFYHCLHILLTVTPCNYLPFVHLDFKDAATTTAPAPTLLQTTAHTVFDSSLSWLSIRKEVQQFPIRSYCISLSAPIRCSTNTTHVSIALIFCSWRHRFSARPRYRTTSSTPVPARWRNWRGSHRISSFQELPVLLGLFSGATFALSANLRLYCLDAKHF